ncbi:AAA family ATPase [Sinorhizobium sp. 8-89]|uniref:AAA family ATPase n=1 Tax=Sinorhizobium sp. 7-81 TaxID=3049087 RepID=UPI0024C4105C|nr:AAA family ATPase [Sinorhizobium sp. 7-81]MDK1389898.1 AAA family ATPase [Sinorhizobium sp. 7-81]
MELRVLGWRYENLRGGLRNVTIHLESHSSRWALIQMPNGTGKTTTMALFRAVFSGEPLSESFVRDLRASDDVEAGLFEISLSSDKKRYRIQLKLDFIRGTYQYRTARAEERGGGMTDGLSLPEELKRLFTPEFTRLFVFDGELAKEIRAVGKDRAAAAISTLYRLDQLDNLFPQIKRLVEDQQQRAAAVSTTTKRKGVTQWQRAFDAASARRALLATQLRELQGKKKEATTRREKLQLQMNERIEQDSALKKRKELLDEKRVEIDLAVLDTSSQSLGILRTPAKLHRRILARLQGLGTKLTHLKLPKTISAEFFKELADQEECVCGSHITPDIRTKILARADNYLAEDQILVINKMKLVLRESSADATEFNTVIRALSTHLRDRDRNRMQHDQLETERVEAGDTEMERLRNEARQADRDLESAESGIEKLTTRDSLRQQQLGLTHEHNIPLCDAEVNRCRDKLATATDTLRFVTQAERMKGLILAISKVALDKLRERVRIATNDKLSKFVPSESLRVSRIGGSLELTSGGLVSKSSVSEGQSLAVAYAFLTSLLSEAPYKLPFIVDSPAVSLDTAVRREVGELIPDLFDQMIMFVISSEREGFADAFYHREGVRYLTLRRLDEETTQVQDGLHDFRSFHQLEAGI